MSKILIIYEGAENTGKTTIKRKVNELLKHDTISFERWTGTMYAYGCVFGRDVNLDEMLTMDIMIDNTFDVLLVYLEANYKDMDRRINTDPMPNDKYKMNPEQISILQYAFKRWFDNTLFENKLIFDTSRIGAREIANCIAARVRMMANYAF